MTQSKSEESTEGQSKQSAHESEDDAAKRRAGHPHKSSEDEKSRIRAGTGKGAGGGAKQKQGH